MKKLLVLILVLSGIFSFATLAGATGAPYRHSTQVTDVTQPYEAAEWIISPDEESKGDQSVGNAPECDIKGVISCSDDKYLRVDILLHQGITYKWAVWYSIKLEYDDMNEYFTYYSDTKELIYEKEENGKIADTKTLTEENSVDWAGVTGSGDVEDSDVYFIINKADHIGGEKGNKYYLTCNFMSGYINKDEKSEVADQTNDVDLEFVY